ncbi:MAG: hydantoinase/oxoprolinase family protein, partial [Methylobacteriaceae bacterium]|nr:hydantoinase/oxoprolinase family protein [Methylobacteriaceae bacterium]
MTARLAVDIGGTFTDFALESGGRRCTQKLLTTPRAPERAVLEGIDQILAEAGLNARDVAMVVHGTTLATNAIIERKGAKTALLTTEGFQDVLLLKEGGKQDGYDFTKPYPRPY